MDMSQVPFDPFVWWFWLAVLRFPTWTGHRIQKCNGPLAIHFRAVWQDMAILNMGNLLSFFKNQVGKLKSPQIKISFFCFLSICEICCDYVFGSPLKNWDRLLLYFRLPALRRLLALSRGLGLPIPKPFRAPFIPGITVRTERRNGRQWDNGEVCSTILQHFFRRKIIGSERKLSSSGGCNDSLSSAGMSSSCWDRRIVRAIVTTIT